MSEHWTLRSALRLCYAVVATLLFVHFIFVFSLTEHVSATAVLVFTIAVALILPPVRRRLEALPVIGRGAIRAVFVLLIVGWAHVLLERGDFVEIEKSQRAFVGATLITGHRGGQPIEDGVVLVDDRGRIVEVGRSASVPIPTGYEIIDLTGMYLMPGLINAHGHLMLSGRVPGEPIEMSKFAMPEWVMDSLSWFLTTYPGKRLVLAQMQKNARKALIGGVTTLRGLGDPGFVDVEMRKRVESGRSLGPRLLVAGPILCVTGGHAHQIGQEIDGPDEARRAVRNSLRHEADVIKIANTGGVSDSRRIGEAGELQMTLEEITAVTDEAHRKHVLVAAHAESSQGVKEALLAGVDSIEHGAHLDDESIALFNHNPKALRGYTTLHPTLSVSRGIEITDEIRDNPVLFIMATNGNMITEAVTTGYKQAVAGGIKTAVGTDAGMVDHGSVWMEMQFFVEIAGISNALALYHGTLGTAESIGVDEITGSIDKGKFADFVVIEENPIEDLSTLAHPSMVVTAGAIVDLR